MGSCAGFSQARVFWGPARVVEGPYAHEGLFPAGFSYEKDTRLYFDDTCVVPERLEGKNLAPEEACRGTRAHGGRCGGGGICSAWCIKPSSVGTVLLRAAEHHPTWQLGITAMLCLCHRHLPACSTIPSTSPTPWPDPAQVSQHGDAPCSCTYLLLVTQPGRGAEPGC